MENYKQKVAGLSDEALSNYIEQRHRYNSDIVLAALIELQKRGRIFPDEELQLIYTDIQLKPGEEKSNNEPEFIPADLSLAPEYYSPLVIRIFSVLFSVLFGSVLMAINLSRANKKNAAVQVVIFGLVYTVAIMITGSFIPGITGGIGIILNIAGAFLMEYFFWNKYIGAQAVYRKRSFVIPLIIGITITALLLTVLFTVGTSAQFITK